MFEKIVSIDSQGGCDDLSGEDATIVEPLLVHVVGPLLCVGVAVVEIAEIKNFQRSKAQTMIHVIRNQGKCNDRDGKE